MISKHQINTIFQIDFLKKYQIVSRRKFCYSIKEYINTYRSYHSLAEALLSKLSIKQGFPDYIWTISSVPLTNMSIFVPVPCIFT